MNNCVKNEQLTEDIKSDHVDLGVTVLASLGGGHVDDLAGLAFDHDKLVLSKVFQFRRNFDIK